MNSLSLLRSAVPTVVIRPPEQLWLFDLPAAPRKTDNVFFALLPDASAADALTLLARRLRVQHGLNGQPLASSRFHVSLNGLGEHAGLPTDLVALAIHAASHLPPLPPFAVKFDRVLSFASKKPKRPFVLRGSNGLGALMAFQEHLNTALNTVGLGHRASQSFTPHVTLLYDREDVIAHAVESVSWTVREFVLVHSLIGQTKYKLLGRWSLGPLAPSPLSPPAELTATRAVDTAATAPPSPSDTARARNS